MIKAAVEYVKKQGGSIVEAYPLNPKRIKCRKSLPGRYWHRPPQMQDLQNAPPLRNPTYHAVLYRGLMAAVI
jgi:hypothetical protein